MYLSRFGVKNYKCLGEIDIPLDEAAYWLGIAIEAVVENGIVTDAFSAGTMVRGIEKILKSRWRGNVCFQRGDQHREAEKLLAKREEKIAYPGRAESRGRRVHLPVRPYRGRPDARARSDRPGKMGVKGGDERSLKPREVSRP